MIISGLQRLTLLDYPGKVACTVFLGGCNFRCPFCHNMGIVENPAAFPQITREELFSFLKKRAGVLDGVCVSGGEPLISDEALTLMEDIKRLGYFVKLDTNGAFPERLKRAVERGLADYVAMDIKNSKEKYAQTAGVKSLDIAPVIESAEYILSSPVKYEFRTTVVSEYHTAEDFYAIGRWLSGADSYYLQAFEDKDTLPFGGLHAPPEEELRIFVDILRQTVKSVYLRGL